MIPTRTQSGDDSVFFGSLSTWRSWALVLIVAVGPFLLKTGLNLESVQRQAAKDIYRSARSSSMMNEWVLGSPVIFETQNEKSLLEDTFRVQLQRDFKLVEIGEVPRVRVFFESGTFLYARLEVNLEKDRAQWIPWNSSVRFINNGLLLGMWIGVLIWIYLQRLKFAAMTSLFCMILWQVDWNLLEVPQFLWVSGRDFVMELGARMRDQQWITHDYGRLVDMSVVGWFIFAVLGYRWAVKKWQGRTTEAALVLSFVLEPVFLWMASKVAAWGADTTWWKIYLGSLSYRFLLFSHLFVFVLRPRHLNFRQTVRNSELQQEQNSWIFYLIPLCFVLCGGWAWVQSVFSVGSSLILLRLKLFFASFVLSFVLGSRFFSLWIASLAFAVILPPTQGHWVASSGYGLMLDGLLLGWFLSPYKGRIPVLSLGERKMPFLVVSGMAWILGIFLSSVGAPTVISWAALALSVWGYAQLSDPHDERNRKDGGSDFDSTNLLGTPKPGSLKG
jgi:hypothetical protein